MREIKFRFWCVDDKMITNYCGVSNEKCEINIAIREMGNRDVNRIIPMQFTGIKDKNGRDVYEGDIVKVYRFEDTVEGIYKIYWGLMEWRLENKDGDYDSGDYYYGDDFEWGAKEIEVIGNIYENPELLESK